MLLHVFQHLLVACAHTGTYIPKKEVVVEETIRATVIKPNQAIKLRARKETTVCECAYRGEGTYLSGLLIALPILAPPPHHHPLTHLLTSPSNPPTHYHPLTHLLTAPSNPPHRHPLTHLLTPTMRPYMYVHFSQILFIAPLLTLPPPPPPPPPPQLPSGS